MARLTDKNRLSLTNHELCKEWDFEKNFPLRPEDVSYGSNKKVWWICSRGHSWRAAITNRSRKKNPAKCSLCSYDVVGIKNGIPKYNNTLKIHNPDLVKEWGFEKNYPLRPEDVSFGSHKKVWWTCSNCRYLWEAVVFNRAKIKKATGCPACCGKVTSILNNLSKAFPKSMQLWDYGRNYPLRPENVSFGSNKVVWWVCPVCNHCWQSSPNNLHRNGIFKDCQACVGHTLSDMNRLSILYPGVSLEWDNERNFPLTPADVSFGSNKKYWWACKKCNRYWEASPNSRTNMSSGCSACSIGPISKMSSEWLDLYSIENTEFTIFCGDKKFIVDGFDPITNTVYEFLGDYWHGNPNRFDADEVNLKCQRTFGQLFDETIERLFLLRQHGYNLNIIWEEDFVV